MYETLPRVTRAIVDAMNAANDVEVPQADIRIFATTPKNGFALIMRRLARSKNQNKIAEAMNAISPADIDDLPTHGVPMDRQLIWQMLSQ